jgi:hypothetical protein
MWREEISPTGNGREGRGPGEAVEDAQVGERHRAEGVAGESYDAEAARGQRRVVEERKNQMAE